MFDHISNLTDQNDHTSAMIEGCKVLSSDFGCNFDNHISKLKIIQRESDKVGHLPYKLGEKRRKLYNGMMAAAKRVMTPKVFESFYMSF